MKMVLNLRMDERSCQAWTDKQIVGLKHTFSCSVKSIQALQLLTIAT